MDHRDGRRRVGWDNFTRVILLLLAFTFHIGVYLLDFPATFLFATSESWLVSHVHLLKTLFRRKIWDVRLRISHVHGLAY